jgi:uncharacterized protein (DUF58 family)
VDELRKRIHALFVRSRLFGEWLALNMGGGGVEFGKVVPFEEGDPEEDIDPLSSKQHGQPMVLKTYPPRQLECIALLDRKLTMRYGSGEFAKRDYAVAAVRACEEMAREYKIGLSLVYRSGNGYGDYRIRSFSHAAGGDSAYAHAQGLSFDAADFSVFEALRRTQKAGFTSTTCFVVIISDFLEVASDYEQQLRSLKRRKHEVAGVAIADPWELDPPSGFFGGVLVRDIRNGNIGFLDSAKDYLGVHKAIFARSKCPFEIVSEGGLA